MATVSRARSALALKTSAGLPEGALSLTGTTRNAFTRQLQNARFELSQNGEMTGTLEELWSSGTTSLSGSLRVFHHLRDMTRVSGE